MTIELEIVRDLCERDRTFGKFFVDGKYLGETLEDTDRFLESGGVKIPKHTCIPRGRYRVTITFSNRFQKPMPYLHDVPQFEGVRIHGGNGPENTEGCPLLGNVRTKTGIANCAGANARLINLIESAEDVGEEVWLTVR